MERQATSSREPPRLAPRALDEEFAAEQVDLEIPVRFYPKVPLADGDEDRRLRDGVGAEVVQLRSIVIAQRPHEPADGDAEASLVKAHEAHDIALRGLRLGLLWPRGNPRWRRISPTAMAPGCPTSLRVEGGCGNEGSEKAKVLSLSLSLSLLPLPPSALGCGLRMQGRRRRRRRMEANGQVSPNTPFLFVFIHRNGRSHSHSPNLPH